MGAGEGVSPPSSASFQRGKVRDAQLAGLFVPYLILEYSHSNPALRDPLTLETVAARPHALVQAPGTLRTEGDPAGNCGVLLRGGVSVWFANFEERPDGTEA